MSLRVRFKVRRGTETGSPTGCPSDLPDDRGGSMAEDHGPPGPDIVDEYVPIFVIYPGPLRSRDEKGGASNGF